MRGESRPGWFVAGVLVWLVLAGLFVMMAVAAVADDNLDWYFAVGPIIGAVFVVLGGLAGIGFALRRNDN
jgi:peptidoglycan/LPS O-acetylase OafA/YrhL